MAHHFPGERRKGKQYLTLSIVGYSSAVGALIALFSAFYLNAIRTLTEGSEMKHITMQLVLAVIFFLVLGLTSVWCFKVRDAND